MQPPHARTSEHVLMLSLELAVPQWVERHRRTAPAERAARARRLGQAIAANADRLLLRGKRPGETADVFNALAEGLALLSFQPGGVEFRGRRWHSGADADHPSSSKLC